MDNFCGIKKKAIFFICLVIACIVSKAQKPSEIPSYLEAYQKQWVLSPREAALAWFKDTRCGMFVHFAPIASQIGEAQYSTIEAGWINNWHKKFSGLLQDSVTEYLNDLFDAHLISPTADSVMRIFTGNEFSADKIADLAVAAGMKYIVFTTQHVGGRMYLFKTATTPINSVEMLPKRDFVAELAKACKERHIGLFLYVGPPHTDPVIRERYRTMLTELLTQYGPIAGIWFDGIGMAYQRPSAFDSTEVSRTYALVRKLQPQCLVSFKTGYTGEEDYLAPEWHQCSYGEDGLPRLGQYAPDGTPKWKGIPQRVHELWQKTLRYKYVQTSTTMLMRGNSELWFNEPNAEGVHHKSAEEVMQQCQTVWKRQQNFVVNIALTGDGSIRADDERVIREFGSRIQERNPRTKSSE